MADIKDKMNDAENKMHELKGRAKQKSEDKDNKKKDSHED
jgi:hypothetical protein